MTESKWEPKVIYHKKNNAKHAEFMVVNFGESGAPLPEEYIEKLMEKLEKDFRIRSNEEYIEILLEDMPHGPRDVEDMNEDWLRDE